MDYNFMKKKVNQFKQQVNAGTQDHTYVLKGFSRILDDQVTPGDQRFLFIYTFDVFICSFLICDHKPECFVWQNVTKYCYLIYVSFTWISHKETTLALSF